MDQTDKKKVHDIPKGFADGRRPHATWCSTLEITENLEVLESEEELIAKQVYEQKSVTSLQNEVDRLKIQLAEAERKLSRSLLKLENVKHDKYLLKFYTGFSCYETLMVKKCWKQTHYLCGNGVGNEVDMTTVI